MARRQKSKLSSNALLKVPAINSEKVYLFLRVLVAVVFAIFLFQDRSFITLFLNGSNDESYFLPFFFLFICYLIPCIYALFKSFESNVLKQSAILFFIALMPRLFFLFYVDFHPTSDFWYYFRFGRDVLAGRAFYYPGYPIIGMMGLQNAAIMSIFSTHIFGFQLAHIFMSCFSCVMLFVILKSWDKRVAVVSAFLFAIYPASVLASVATTNRNSALLFMLLSIFFIQKMLATLDSANIRQPLWYVLIATVFFMISHFFHISGIIILASFGLYLALYCVNRKQFVKRLLLLYMVPVAAYAILPSFLISVTYNIGIIQSKESLSNSMHLAVGTSYPTGCLDSFRRRNLIYNPHILDWRRIEIDGHPVASWSLDRAVQRRIFNEVTISNLRDMGFSGTIRLLRNKFQSAWIGGCSYVYIFPWHVSLLQLDRMANEGLLSTERYQYREKLRMRIIPGLTNLDIVFTQFIYILSIVGIALRRKIEDESPTNIFTFVLGGWILKNAISQQQSRYRFLGMPTFMIFAAIGIVCLYDLYKRYNSKDSSTNVSNIKKNKGIIKVK